MLNSKLQWQKLLLDIRVWIVFYFVLRLIGLFDPPAEYIHNWRQTTVTMAARNFLEVDANIFYPRIDFAGEKTGITGMEFPLLNYLIYLISAIFGYTHWYGRAIVLISSSIGIWYFYKLIKKYFEEDIAFYSSALLLVSIWFTYSRKVMPDTFAMTLLIMAFYYGSHFLDRKASWGNWVTYFILSTLGILAKLPVAYLFILWAPFMLDSKILLRRKFWIALASGLALLPSIYWYFIWVPHLVETYQFWHFFMGKSFSEGFRELYEHYRMAAFNFYDAALKHSGFILFVLGLIEAIRRRQWQLLTIFGLGAIGFLVIMAKAGFTFTHHTYYVIPFVPIMALIAGYGLTQLQHEKAFFRFFIPVILLLIGYTYLEREGYLFSRRTFVKQPYIPLIIAFAAFFYDRYQNKVKAFAFVLLLLTAYDSWEHRSPDLFMTSEFGDVALLEDKLDQVNVPRDTKILINSGSFPSAMYFAHRKGWIRPNEEVAKREVLHSLQQHKLTHVVILKRVDYTSDMTLPDSLATQIYNDKNFRIYELLNLQ